MIGTQFIKQQIDEGHLLLQEIPLSPQEGVVSKVTDTTSFSFNTSSSIVIAHF